MPNSGYKRYASLGSAKAAIRKAGLHLMTVDYPVAEANRSQRAGIEPVVVCADGEDAAYIRVEKRFNAIVDVDRAAKEDA